MPVLNLNYNEERLTSYETGFKSTFWDGKARLNGDVFYYDYKDYQGFFLDVATTIVENVNAKVKGGELELAVTPLRGLNTAARRVLSRHARRGRAHARRRLLVTAQLPQAPIWSLNAEARYEWPAFGGQLSVESDAKWNQAQYLELINAEDDLEPSVHRRQCAGRVYQRQRPLGVCGLLQKPHRSLVSGI